MLDTPARIRTPLSPLNPASVEAKRRKEEEDKKADTRTGEKPGAFPGLKSPAKGSKNFGGRSKSRRRTGRSYRRRSTRRRA